MADVVSNVCHNPDSGSVASPSYNVVMLLLHTIETLKLAMVTFDPRFGVMPGTKAGGAAAGTFTEAYTAETGRAMIGRAKSGRKGIAMFSGSKVLLVALALLLLPVAGLPVSSVPAEASVSAERSRQCSAEARRWADRHTRGRTAAGAAGGAAIGAAASQSRRNTGRNAARGALIGGGAGLISGGGRWQTYYNYAYRNCVRRR